MKNTNNEIKPLSNDKKDKKLLTDIRGGWYIEIITKGLQPLTKQKLSKNHRRNMIKLNGNYTLLIGIGMIGNYN